MYELYRLFPDETITWKDLVFMSMAFSIIVSMLGFPPIVSAVVSLLMFSFFHVNVDVADKENKEARKAAFIASLFTGVVVGYVMAFKFSQISIFMSSPLKIGVVLLCIISLMHYGEKLRFWTLDNDYSAFIIDNWMRWRDVIFITLALSSPLGAIDNGTGSLVAAFTALVFYGFMKIYNQDMNQKFSFILSIIIGITTGAMITFKNYKGDINYSNPIFIVSIISLINYISTIYNVPISAGIITLLFSIIPALAIGGENIGLTMFISSIVSFGIMLFVPYNKSKPWILRQSIYVGLLVGIGTSIFTELLYTNTDKMEFSIDAFMKHIKKAYLSFHVLTPLNTIMGYTWVTYFIIYILSLFPGDKILPTGWLHFLTQKSWNCREVSLKETKSNKDNTI